MTELATDQETVEPECWHFWGTVLWSIPLFAVFVVISSLPLLFDAVKSVPPGVDYPEFSQRFTDYLNQNLFNGTDLALGEIWGALVTTGAIFLVIRLKNRSVIQEYLALNPVALPTILKWFGVTLVVCVLLDLLGYLLHYPIVPEFMRAAYVTAAPLWVLWVGVVIMAPWIEELLFRGLKIQQ